MVIFKHYLAVAMSYSSVSCHYSNVVSVSRFAPTDTVAVVTSCFAVACHYSDVASRVDASVVNYLASSDK